MHWLWMIIIGLIIGVIAKFFDRDHAPVGWILTIVIGIIGSVLATWIGEKLGWWGPTGFVHFIASVVGAIILLAIYTAFKRKGGGGVTAS
ncbi:MAG: GlsB/YeaQ/YmgE family stress response membrane protein [Rhodanobacteraceae bacterium]|nr:MAG: GlsB/YeaQ/YmgE family stress response membrane protein [Rhodanobacteraceae bacterium]